MYPPTLLLKIIYLSWFSSRVVQPFYSRALCSVLMLPVATKPKPPPPPAPVLALLLASVKLLCQTQDHDTTSQIVLAMSQN